MLFTVPAFLIIFSLLIDNISVRKEYLVYLIVSVVILISFISVYIQVRNVDKDDWQSVVDYINENVKEGEAIFINPFYHQDPFTFYYDRECFLSSDIYSCNYEDHNIVSLKWYANCCSSDTRLTATDEKNLLGNYINNTVWQISVKEELYNAPLNNYFFENMDLVENKEFGDVKIYKFESKLNRIN